MHPVVPRPAVRRPAAAFISVVVLLLAIGRTAAFPLSAQLDVFNVLNLLRKSWGLYRTAPGPLLVQVSQAAAGSPLAQPVFMFDATRPRWTVSPLESAYQLQLALRYSF